jgi:hypothetical protein
VQVAPPGTMARHARRVAVLEMARATMEGVTAADGCAVGRGCAVPYAYETALRYLEIEEEVAAGAPPAAHLSRAASGVRRRGQGEGEGVGERCVWAAGGRGGGKPAGASIGAQQGLALNFSDAAHQVDIASGPGALANGLPSPRVPSGSRSPLVLPPPALTPSGSFVHHAGSFFGSLAAQGPLAQQLAGGSPRYSTGGGAAGAPDRTSDGGGGRGMSRHASAARLAELVANPMAGCNTPQVAPELAAPGAGAELAAAASLQLPPAAAPPPAPLTPAASGSLPRIAAHVPASPRVPSLPGSPAATPRGLGMLLARFGSVEMGLGSLSEAGPAAGGGGGGGGAAPLLARDSEAIAQRLAHAFPWNKTGQVRGAQPAARGARRATHGAQAGRFSGPCLMSTSALPAPSPPYAHSAPTPSTQAHLALALRRREAYLPSGAATLRLQCGWAGPNTTDWACAEVAATRAPARRKKRMAGLIKVVGVCQLHAGGAAAPWRGVSSARSPAGRRLPALSTARGAAAALPRPPAGAHARARVGRGLDICLHRPRRAGARGGRGRGGAGRSQAGHQVCVRPLARGPRARAARGADAQPAGGAGGKEARGQESEEEAVRAASPGAPHASSTPPGLSSPPRRATLTPPRPVSPPCRAPGHVALRQAG